MRSAYRGASCSLSERQVVIEKRVHKSRPLVTEKENVRYVIGRNGIRLVAAGSEGSKGVGELLRDLQSHRRPLTATAAAGEEDAFEGDAKNTQRKSRASAGLYESIDALLGSKASSLAYGTRRHYDDWTAAGHGVGRCCRAARCRGILL